MSTPGMPSRMRAIALTGIGGPERLEPVELDVPEPGPGEVLVAVRTVGANRQDTFTMRGAAVARHPIAFPHVMGIDPAGVVVATGAGVVDPAPGTRVVVKPSIACGACPDCRAGADDACPTSMNVGVHRPGGMAEYVAVPATNAFPIPDRLPFAAATASAHSFPVALQLIRERGRLVAGETVLVTAAAGAVGSAAVQLAKLFGARVVAAAGGAAKVAHVRSLGPDLVVDYGAEPAFGPLVRSFAPGGVDLYVESAGNPAIWREAVGTLARRGRAVVCGAHAGPVVELDLAALFRLRASILGGSGATLATQREALELVADGRLRPNVHGELPLGQARDAFGILARRENVGKVILRVAPDQ